MEMDPNMSTKAKTVDKKGVEGIAAEDTEELANIYLKRQTRLSYQIIYTYRGSNVFRYSFFPEKKRQLAMDLEYLN